MNALLDEGPRPVSVVVVPGAEMTSPSNVLVRVFPPDRVAGALS